MNKKDERVRDAWDYFIKTCRNEKVVISLFFPYADNSLTFNPFREVELGLSSMEYEIRNE